MQDSSSTHSAGESEDGVLLECPDCGGGYRDPVPIHGQDEMHGGGNIVGYACPHCDAQLSEHYTRLQNIRTCGHNATSDLHGDNGVYEVCQECGGKFDLHGNLTGIKEAWAVPSSM